MYILYTIFFEYWRSYDLLYESMLKLEIFHIWILTLLTNIWPIMQPSNQVIFLSKFLPISFSIYCDESHLTSRISQRRAKLQPRTLLLNGDVVMKVMSRENWIQNWPPSKRTLRRRGRRRYFFFKNSDTIKNKMREIKLLNLAFIYLSRKILYTFEFINY